MIGNTIIRLNSVDSTNSYLSQLVKKKELKEGVVVFAQEQLAGRGQLNNVWESEQGKNILISVLLFPHFLKAENQFLLSKIISLGILDFLSACLKDVKIKWPNDIYVGEKKIAGVLIENTIRGSAISNSIAGIGLNVNQTLFSASLPNPTSLKLETLDTFDLNEVLEKLCAKLEARYKQSLVEGEIIAEEYIARLYRYKTRHLYRDNKGEFYATITNIDKYGRLCLLDEKNNMRKYAFKEVEFI